MCRSRRRAYSARREAQALSNDVHVPDASGSDGSVSNERGVLANLPRTRPQRSSARRAAARESARAAGGNGARAPAGPAPAKRARPTSKRAGGSTRPAQTRPSAAAERARSRPQQAAPRQGFETEPQAARGSVQPPGGAELVASAAELVGELAKAGLSRGERAIRDLLGRLPL